MIAITFAYPFIPASNQIYPEILSGTILLFFITYLISNETSVVEPNISAIIPLSLAIAYLPWLQIKFAAPALIAACALGYSIEKATNNFKSSLYPLALLLTSIIILIYYNIYAFGNAFGPYNDGTLQMSSTSLMVLLGLHLDRFQGLFFQNVTFLFMPMFIISFYRKSPFITLVILIIYASIVVPNALHPNWYGGFSFAGRFQWAGAIVLIPLVVYALIRMIELYPRIGSVLIASAIFINAIVYVQYTFTGFDLYNRGLNIPFMAYPSFIPLIGGLLPVFDNVSWAYSYAVNSIWIAIILFITSIGLMYSLNFRRKFPSIYSILGFSLLGVLLIVSAIYHPYPQETFYYDASELPFKVGQINDGSREIKNDARTPGFLSYGPYISLPLGDYIATFEYTSNVSPETTIGWIDIVTNMGQNVITKEPVYGINDIPVHIEMPFGLQQATQKLEVRFFYDGTGAVSLRSLEIWPNWK